MTEPSITQLLHAAADGDPQALESLSEEVYRDLEKIAAARLRAHYGAGAEAHTLEPAALVNEALLKLVREPRAFENRRHFFAFLTTVMINVMLEYQRRQSAEKRGGDRVRVTLSDLQADASSQVGLLDFQRALVALESLDERKAAVVRLRAVWGLENAEIGGLLEVSERTVERDWKFSKAWLAARANRPEQGQEKAR